jgi:protein TonB
MVISAALLLRAKPLPEAQEAQQGVSVTLDNGGAPQNTAPPAPTQALPQPAQSPQAPPPPPPPPAPAQPEVNLNIPDNLLATLPPPTPQPRAVPHPRPRPAPQHHYVLMMNGMSYGNPSPYAPAPPAHKSLNLALPQSDAQAVAGQAITVKGNIGADWMSELNDWVNAHKYYPAQAAEQGQQGTAEIEFTVDRQGNVTGLRLLNSSGSNFLDLAWLGLFQGVTLPPFPAGTKDDHITIDATMQYQLVQP